MLRRLSYRCSGRACTNLVISKSFKKFQIPHIALQTTHFSTTPEKPKGGILSLESNVASENFKSRWLMVIPAVVTHMCIGSPYAWSLMADMITREYGFVASAAADWGLAEAALPLSLVLGIFGLTAPLVGKWQIKVGARKSMAVASAVFGTGVAISGVAIQIHSLPLLYFGYGVLGGLGLAFTYTPPLQILMQWFPDKKGIASGLTIAGFGSGALLYTPIANSLIKTFAQMPTYLGPMSEYVTRIVDGKMYVDVDGKAIEVVYAGVKELSRIPFDLSEGLYIVGTGSTGAAETLMVMGTVYFLTMLAAALSIKGPHPSFQPPALIEKPSIDGSVIKPPPIVKPVVDLTVDQAALSRQFHLLGLTFFCLGGAGIGVMSVAKPMMSEVFSAALPHIVTSAFASQFILMLATGNLVGRLAWAAVSDSIGRRKTFLLFTISSVPLYFLMPYFVYSVLYSGSAIPLYGYCAAATLAIANMGAIYAILPAYEADLFGTKYVGAIHGRMLFYSAMASLSGPQLVIYLRGLSEKAALTDLVSKIDPTTFQQYFGTTVDHMDKLIATKTLTINKALALAPQGTIDPTPHLYDTSMYALGGMMVVAVIAHYNVRPISGTFVDRITHANQAKVTEVKDVTDVKDTKEVTELKEVKDVKETKEGK